jgi:meiosis induction protein kinase IME2/SME1
MGSPENLVGHDFLELDKALQGVRTSLDASSHNPQAPPVQKPSRLNGGSMLKRHHSVGNSNGRSADLNRKAAGYKTSQPNLHYETPDEEEELLDEALSSARKATNRLDQYGHKPTNHYTMAGRPPAHNYLTPSPSANRSSVGYDHMDYISSKPVDIKPQQPQNNYTSKWPTPPYEESDWAASAAASIIAAQAAYR